MTIHKSKGLEFEVVIVPDLQVSPRHSKHEMLSWLERGIPPGSDPGDSGEITEFLVAPFQSKGAESSAAKKWVDRVRGDRESQETRRILYVAATRAREELHLFARPSYKTAQDGSLTLADPRNSLLATAWPAFENEIRARFDEWRAQIAQTAEPATIDSLAASAAVNLRSTVPPIFPALLRRLPSDFAAAHPHSLETAPESALVGAGRLYERHEGGLLSRALGIAVHAFLQQLAQLLASQSSHAIPTLLAPFEPRIAAQVRAAGVDPTSAKRIAAQALQIALHAAADPLGNWILAPHADAASEVRWTGIVNGVIRTVQVDRVFRAGHAPQSANSASNSSWWIIDYKTAHEDMPDPASALPDCAESSRRRSKPTQRFSAIFTASMRQSSPASTTRACRSSTGGSFNLASATASAPIAASSSLRLAQLLDQYVPVIHHQFLCIPQKQRIRQHRHQRKRGEDQRRQPRLMKIAAQEAQPESAAAGYRTKPQESAGCWCDSSVSRASAASGRGRICAAPESTATCPAQDWSQSQSMSITRWQLASKAESGRAIAAKPESTQAPLQQQSAPGSQGSWPQSRRACEPAPADKSARRDRPRQKCCRAPPARRPAHTQSPRAKSTLDAGKDRPVQNHDEHQRSQQPNQLRSVAAKRKPLLAQARAHNRRKPWARGLRRRHSFDGLRADLFEPSQALRNPFSGLGSLLRSDTLRETACGVGSRKQPQTVPYSPAKLQIAPVLSAAAPSKELHSPQIPAAANSNTTRIRARNPAANYAPPNDRAAVHAES